MRQPEDHGEDTDRPPTAEERQTEFCSFMAVQGPSSSWWRTGAITRLTSDLTVHASDSSEVAPKVPGVEGEHEPPGQPHFTNRYRLGSEIGRGGVGVVYEGWDLQLERKVCFKVLHKEHLSDPTIVRRFLEEARITSQLQHPGIVPIHDLGVLENHRPCFVMSLVKGETLDRILARRSSTLDRLTWILSVFEKICEVIAFAHSQGILHRDLKPANIMVGDFGVVKVMDWGLGKILTESVDPSSQTSYELSDDIETTNTGLLETQIGTIFGTPAYLSPEQARGEMARVDQRTDVFGLGAILLEILTGIPPYTGTSSRSIFQKALEGRIESALARLETCPVSHDLQSLARICLEPDRDRRPASGSVVLEAISSHLRRDQRRAERDLVRFFDLSLDLFCIANNNARFLRVNDNFTRVLGYTFEELTSQSFLCFVHPEDVEKTNQEVQKLSRGEPCIQFLNRYRHADGHYLWLEWMAQSAPDENAVYAVARVVTDRMELAAARREAEKTCRHLAQIVDSAQVAIISTDLAGLVESWNPAAIALFGYAQEEALNQSVYLLIPDEFLAQVARSRDQVIRSGRVRHFESFCRHKDGSILPVSMTISPVCEATGEVTGTSLIARNISDRKQAEAALRESEVRLRALVESDIVAVVLFDASGRIDFINPTAAHLFGYLPRELEGRSLDLLLPDLGQASGMTGILGALDEAARGIPGQSLERTGKRKDGSAFPLELIISELRVGGRCYYSGLIRDLTSRRAHEQTEADHRRATEFAIAVGQTLTQAKPRSHLLQEFAQLAVDRLDLSLVRIWTINPERTFLELQAQAGIELEEMAQSSRRPLNPEDMASLSRYHHLNRTSPETGNPILEDELRHLPLRIQSLARYPLVLGDQVLGILEAAGMRPISGYALEALAAVSASLALLLSGARS